MKTPLALALAALSLSACVMVPAGHGHHHHGPAWRSAPPAVVVPGYGYRYPAPPAYRERYYYDGRPYRY